MKNMNDEDNKINKDDEINNIDNKDNFKNKIGCILFMVWFIGSLIIMISFKKYSIIVLLQYFLVFIIGAIRSSVVKIMSLLIRIFKIIFGILTYFLLFYILKMIFDWDWNLFFRVFVLSVAVTFASLFLLIQVLRIVKLKKRCIVLVNASIVRYESIRSKDFMQRLYSPVYGFNYNNNYYEICWNFFSNDRKFKQINSAVDVMVNPDNPYEIYVPKDNAMRSYILIVCIATSSCIISFTYGIIAILFGL